MPSLFILFQHVAPQHFFSRIVGFLAESRFFRKPFIGLFSRFFKVDLSEAVIENPSEFENFNAFFTRALKNGSRPIDDRRGAIVSPADGAISQLGKITSNRLLQAKGREYTIEDLLVCDSAAASQFSDGSFITVYLSPRDYHRVHMPIAGTLRKTTYVPGDLFSVNQKTAEAVPKLFARNERLVCVFDTELGPMALVLVGAMIVAGIETVWSGAIAPNNHRTPVVDESHKGISLAVGEELGRFKLGSTVILLFQKDTIQLNQELAANSAVKMGEMIGSQLDLKDTK